MSACCSCSEKSASTNDTIGTTNLWIQFAISGALAGLSMSLSLGLNLSPPGPDYRLPLHGALIVLVLVVFAICGTDLVRSVWQALRRRRLATDELFFVAMIGAFALSLESTIRGQGPIYYEVVVILLAIRTLGRALLENQRLAVTTSLDRWREELSSCLRITESGLGQRTRIKELRPGDHVIVSPGESIPVDGVVEAGESYVQQNAHTGEPFPVVVQRGSHLLAGSRVLDAEITLRVSSLGQSREIDRLSNAIAKLSTHKSRTEHLLERAVSFFLPGVLLVSLITFFAHAFAGNLTKGLFDGLSVLLVACPCALGLAVPWALTLGYQRLAELGIRPHTPSLIEDLARIKTVVFDKTGTLTQLHMEADPVSGKKFSNDVRAMVAALQRRSEHPVARPFWLWNEPLPAAWELAEVSTIPARGIRGTFHTPEGIITMEIGNSLLLANSTGNGVGNSVQGRELYILYNGKLAGSICLRESLLPGLIELKRKLASQAVAMAIITGDLSVPEEINEMNVPVFTEASTTEKAHIVGRMEYDSGAVLFFGDGINDAEVMTRATASLAVDSGHAIAQEAADGIWSADSFTTLPEVLQVARLVRARIKAIIFFSFGYNAIGVGLAAAGFINPILASLLMLGSSLTVTAIAASTGTSQPGVPIRKKVPTTSPLLGTSPLIVESQISSDSCCAAKGVALVE